MQVLSFFGTIIGLIFGILLVVFIGLPISVAIIAVFGVGILWVLQQLLYYKLIFGEKFNKDDIDGSVTYGFTKRVARISNEIDYWFIRSDKTPADYKQVLNILSDEIMFAYERRYAAFLWRIVVVIGGVIQYFIIFYILLNGWANNDIVLSLIFVLSLVFGFNHLQKYYMAFNQYIMSLTELKIEATMVHLLNFTDKKIWQIQNENFSDDEYKKEFENEIKALQEKLKNIEYPPFIL
ncbi:hypothetical protein OFN70_07580 [Campylobacter sp. CN_NE3]|uniref:hypothetical protein n=1 Tax=Campylobacter sp. CN_NE3 TaxID=2984149 RepID=UPI0022E9E987|nr:hypothetical protein [Campylobacter sp. CN_NE3]MDA3069385.1 hypothetical protein [Campylobacter sp. CN_NE3]